MYEPWRPKELFQFEIIINVFVNLSDSFEYLCYVSTSPVEIDVDLNIFPNSHFFVSNVKYGPG